MDPDLSTELTMAALRHGPFAQAAAMVTVTAHGLPALRPLAVAGTIALSHYQ